MLLNKSTTFDTNKPRLPKNQKWKDCYVLWELKLCFQIISLRGDLTFWLHLNESVNTVLLAAETFMTINPGRPTSLYNASKSFQKTN